MCTPTDTLSGHLIKLKSMSPSELLKYGLEMVPHYPSAIFAGLLDLA